MPTNLVSALSDCPLFLAFLSLFFPLAFLFVAASGGGSEGFSHSLPCLAPCTVLLTFALSPKPRQQRTTPPQKNTKNPREKNEKTGHTASVEAVGFCPAGQAAIAASCGLDAFLRAWDAGAGFAPRAAVEHPDGVTRLAWHPRQPAVVATACLDGRVRLCDLRTGKVVVGGGLGGGLGGGGGGGGVLRGHAAGAAVQDVCFSPDGSMLLSGSDDGTARVFAVQM